MKTRLKVIFAASALMLAACALAAGVGRMEYAAADLAKRTATVAWTWTDLADNAVRLSLTRNGEDFPTAGWGGTLFIGDGALGCAVAGTAHGYNELLFDVGRDNVPTNGRYSVQILATNTAGRVEEWARGTLTVRANPAADGMPTNWSAYADIARKVAPFIDARGILADPANADALWGAVSNRTDALIQAVSPTPDFTTSNAVLVATIEIVAPAPGDYAAVSNRAMSAVQSLAPATNYVDAVAQEFQFGTRNVGYADAAERATFADYWNGLDAWWQPERLSLQTEWQADVADATNALAQSIGGAADLAPMTNYVDAATNAIMTLARAKTDMNVYGEERSAVWVASAQDGYDVEISGAEWVDWGESDFTGYFFSGTIARGGDSHEFQSVQAMESYPTGTDPATVGEAAFEVGFDGATVAVSVTRNGVDGPTVVAPTGDMLATTGQVAAATNALDRAIRADFPSGTPEWRTARFWAEAGESLSFVTNGAAEFHIGYVSGFGVDTNGWPEGAALFVRGTYDTGYALESLPGNVRLAGYGEWPTNDFQSVWWRMGTNVFVNVLVEE